MHYTVGDNIDQQAVQIGVDITASVDIQSREYNGNWYTDIKAWRVEQGTGEQHAEIPPPSTESFEIDTQAFNDIDDDLPFNLMNSSTLRRGLTNTTLKRVCWFFERT